MQRPLYKEAQDKIDWKGGNTGLWYDKFFDRWQKDGTIKDGDKQAWIETVEGRCGDRDLLGQMKHRISYLLESAGGQPLFYTLESDFVTGLGRQHPVENGFAWHHTLGTPYLPGSSVKGMVRVCAEHWEKADKADLKRIFGSESKDERNFYAGSVIFLDALPTAPVTLKADIMTPHYGPYYQGDEPPADWHSPNPIPFLVVKAGASLMFGVLPRTKEGESDCEKVRGWLKEALEWIGAGAKTAVGYGRFTQDVSAQQAFEQQREQERAREEEDRRQREETERKERKIEVQTQDKSPLYAELFRASIEGNWREDINTFNQQGVIEGWLDRLEADPQRDAIDLFHELMRQHYGDILANPDATKGKKGKPKHKPRPQAFAKRMLKLLEIS